MNIISLQNIQWSLLFQVDLTKRYLPTIVVFFIFLIWKGNRLLLIVVDRKLAAYSLVSSHVPTCSVLLPFSAFHNIGLIEYPWKQVARHRLDHNYSLKQLLNSLRTPKTEIRKKEIKQLIDENFSHTSSSIKHFYPFFFGFFEPSFRGHSFDLFFSSFLGKNLKDYLRLQICVLNRSYLPHWAEAYHLSRSP